MTRKTWFATIALLIFVVSAASTTAGTLPAFQREGGRQGVAPPGMDPLSVAAMIGHLCEDAPPGLSWDNPCVVSDFERSIITGQIVHYAFKVRYGAGPYDVIGIHRIVMERGRFRRGRSQDAILLLHGDLLGFEGGFLGNLRTPGASADHALPVYLAENGIDVWGIDQGWTLVPADETDFTWADGWGFDKELHALRLAANVTRVVRAGTGSGFGPISLLGWSRGAQVAMAYANEETQLAPGVRTVKGIVYADVFLKLTDPVLIQAQCEFYQGELDIIASGELVDTTGGLFILLGELAIADPYGDSPVFPGFTNETAALFLGAVPFGYPMAPSYHLCAGEFDADGVPFGLQYTDEDLFFHWFTGAAPYEPWQIEVDGDSIGCDQVDVPWDDHLDEITAPILYIEAAGGAAGDYGRQTLEFLPNAPITELRVQLHPDGDGAFDFAHVDLWTAENAPDLVWEPILDWIREN